MIKLEKQALALNAEKVPGPDYRMNQTVKLSSAATAVEVVNHINAAANVAEGRLANVVINTHGSPGVAHLGEGTYLRISDIGLFKQVSGKIGTLWFTGCQIGSGAVFCAQLAVTAGCFVVAADVYQYVNPGFYLRLFPQNCIDDYEGVAYRWDVAGNKTEFSRRDWLGFDDTRPHGF